jgi:hypothetical protein
MYPSAICFVLRLHEVQTRAGDMRLRGAVFLSSGADRVHNVRSLLAKRWTHEHVLCALKFSRGRADGHSGVGS